MSSARRRVVDCPVVPKNSVRHFCHLTATAKHRTPWAAEPDGPLLADQWELYHVAEDFSQAKDVAAEHPEKLEELQALFMKEAVKYNVLPLDDRVFERFNAAIAGRPDLMGDCKTLTLYPGMTRIMENAFINVKSRSHSITAEVEVPEGGGEGVIICQGGKFAGWSLYMKDGKATYVHNWVGKALYTVTSPLALAPGKATGTKGSRENSLPNSTAFMSS